MTGTTKRISGLHSVKRVLVAEADAIIALAESLDTSVTRALDTLAAVRGRVVVSGMGKSGHIAQKIAATLASVGTPAQFVHPGEARHGDLGMVTKDDAALLLSNSGETPELSDIVAYTRRFAIPLVAITGQAGSTLAAEADVALILPSIPEADPMALVPTTSTTMMLALGDALAVGLLERKGFSRNDYHELHPGGPLGRGLVRVGELMHTGEDVPLVDLDTLMSEAIVTMTAKGFGCVGAIDDGGRLVGIVTDGDLRRHMASDLIDRQVREVMSGSPRTISAQSLAGEALLLMNANAFTNLFVTDGDKPVGILHIHDCLRAGIQ